MFWATFDHFWKEPNFLRQLGQQQKMDLNLKSNRQIKLSLSKSLMHMVVITIKEYVKVFFCRFENYNLSYKLVPMNCSGNLFIENYVSNNVVNNWNIKLFALWLHWFVLWYLESSRLHLSRVPWKPLLLLNEILSFSLSATSGSDLEAML